MRNLARLSIALLAAAAATLSCGPVRATVDVPTWVPAQYAKFFYRHVDERPAWERALGYLNVTVGETGPSFALIAGVSSYPNMSGGASDLWPARLDVEKMAAYLESEPESFNEIVVLLDEDMTPDNLRYFLTQYFPRRLSETTRSRFLFAYSGHGMTAPNGRGYILTSQAESLEDRFNAGISLAALRAEFQEIVDSGHQVLALINACYGVDFHRLSLAFGREEDAPLPTREGAHAITAGGAGELTWHDPTFGEGDGPKGSVFFEAVFAALDGRADKLPSDGIVTIGELETYLKITVSRFTDERQNPTGGDLISTRSPGGFFFLDRNRQIENGNAVPLVGEWWDGVAFGAPVEQETAPEEADGLTLLDAIKPSFEDDPPSKNSMVLDESDVANAPSYELPPEPIRNLLDAMAGRWAGFAEEPGGIRFEVEVELLQTCDLNQPCGSIAVPHVPCRGRLTLVVGSSDGMEFHVDQFDETSDRSTCHPGAGEVMKLQPDGTLAYTATYSGATGILERSE